MIDHFLSCDWGTSNLRLRLIVLPDLQVVAEVTSDKGISDTAKAWAATGVGKSEEEKLRFYTAVLQEQVAALQQQTEQQLDGLRIVISGMASSSIGLANLPYAALPLPTDGSGLCIRSFLQRDDFPHPLLLISGVRGERDVIRGEETQLIGCLTPEMVDYAGEQMVIHPGTHSKHITIRNKQVTGFKTYMTGEFFKLLSTHGILRDNVTINAFSPDGQKAFELGVKESKAAPLLHAAFGVRANDLFGKLSKEENYHYLSGLLIGTELQSLEGESAKIFLCCGPSLFQQYSAALQVSDLHRKVQILPAEWEESAVIRGQAKILQHIQP